MNVSISYPNNQIRGRMNFDRSLLLQVAGRIKGVDILFAEPMICVSGVHGTLCPSHASVAPTLSRTCLFVILLVHEIK